MNKEGYEDQEFEELEASLGDYIYLQDENGKFQKTYIGWCG